MGIRGRPETERWTTDGNSREATLDGKFDEGAGFRAPAENMSKPVPLKTIDHTSWKKYLYIYFPLLVKNPKWIDLEGNEKYEEFEEFYER